MNELEIIRHQLATERQHVAEVVGAFDDAMLGTGAEAYLDYLAFALRRLESSAASNALTHLDAVRRAALKDRASRAHEFLQLFNTEWQRHLQEIDAAGSRNLRVAQWRAIAQVDADSILEERKLYEKVKDPQP
jgi:hypothetical protein